MKIKILDEVHTIASEYGAKNQATVEVTNGLESHKKTMNFNKPTISYLVKKFGSESKKWIGKEIEITTKTIKNNLAIVPKV